MTDTDTKHFYNMHDSTLEILALHRDELTEMSKLLGKHTDMIENLTKNLLEAFNDINNILKTQAAALHNIEGRLDLLEEE